jgi:hypothetical protein
MKLQLPCSTWKSAKWNIGELFQFINALNPLDIRTGTVVGWDCQDRLLADYPLTNGVIAKGASIHVNTILPKQL